MTTPINNPFNPIPEVTGLPQIENPANTPDGNVLRVPTIAALKALAPKPEQTVLVETYAKPGDGGGGLFTWDAASTVDDDRGTIIAPQPVPPTGRWQRLWSDALNVRWFGAQGDWNEATQTGTDDYDALQAAAAAINVRKGGTLVFPPGTYRVDRYQIGDSPNKNNVQSIIYRNCNGLHIIGHGAKIDVKGDFHRSADYLNPTNNYWYSHSNCVQPFIFQNCVNLKLEGLELNGNVDKMTRDSGVVEGPGSGVVTDTCSQYTFTNLYVHHFQTDGLILGADNPVADRNALLLNVRSLYNARNALSIISLRGATFIHCQFSQSGRSAGSYGTHAPSAGLDIEPEVQTDVPTGDFTFLECEFANNSGSGLAASAGETVFKHCLFWGTGYYSIIANARKLVFEDCEIYGECLNWFTSSLSDETSKYSRCHFEDKNYPSTNTVWRSAACISTSGGNVQIEDCLVVANKTQGLYLDGSISKHIVRNTTIIHKWQGSPGQQSLVRSCVLENVHFKENIEAPPSAITWFINADQPEIIDRVYADGPYVKWMDNSGAILPGHTVGNTRPFPRTSLQLNANMHPLGPYQGYITLGAMSSPPTSGTWNTGDIVFNQNPVPGGKIGWVYAADGKWHSFGSIDS